MSIANEHCHATVTKLSASDTEALLGLVSGWAVHEEKLIKTFKFSNYYETMAFVNASAWISHAEDHHPELHITYNACRVAFDTHSVDGLSRNDFVCAAKLDALI